MTEEGGEAAAPLSTNSSPMDHEKVPNDNVSGSDKYEADADDAKNDIDDDHGSSTRQSPPQPHHRQIICQLDRSKSMFRVTKAKGKALYTGGFGISMTTTDKNSTKNGAAVAVAVGMPFKSTTKDDGKLDNEVTAGVETVVDACTAVKTDDPHDQCAPPPPPLASPPQLPPKKTTAEYLFIEEVVFLHERGILEARSDEDHRGDDGDEAKDDDDADDSSSPRSKRVVLDTSQLFQMLPAMGVSLPVYLVYAHLCGQDFRVIRHDPKRSEILVEQQQQLVEQEQEQKEKREKQQQQERSMKIDKPDETPISTTAETTTTTATTAATTTTATPTTKISSRQKATLLRKRVRESIQTAPAPVIPQDSISSTGITATTTNDAIRICWDCNNPNSHFGKTKPGFPDFFVAVTHYNIPLVKFSDLQALLQGSCQNSTTRAAAQAIVQIPLKVATVSDSGTVVMFGVTGYNIPNNDKNGKDDEE